MVEKIFKGHKLRGLNTTSRLLSFCPCFIKQKWQVYPPLPNINKIFKYEHTYCLRLQR
nr:MAG TPA: hypothetical protein [Caudoviricetes sp.]